MLKAVPWDLLGGPHGRNEDRKDARIGSAYEEKKIFAWEKGQIRPAEQCPTSRDIGSTMTETKS